MQELELYKESLTDKPALLAINKMEVEGADAKYAEFIQLVEHYKGKRISLFFIQFFCIFGVHSFPFGGL